VVVLVEKVVVVVAPPLGNPAVFAATDVGGGGFGEDGGRG